MIVLLWSREYPMLIPWTRTFPKHSGLQSHEASSWHTKRSAGAVWSHPDVHLSRDLVAESADLNPINKKKLDQPVTSEKNIETWVRICQNMSDMCVSQKKKNIVVHLCRVASRDDVVLIWDVIGGAQPAFGLVELRETSDLRPCITPQSKNKPKKYPQQQQLH